VGSQIRLVSIPSTDARFADFATRALEEIPAGLGNDAARAELERRLRRFYPGAVVRARDPLATYEPPTDVVWYATNRGYDTPIHESVEIAAPRELVFDTYVDRYPEWQSAVAVRRIEAAAPVLAAYGATYEIFGRRFEGRFDVVEVERPSFVRVEATSTSGIAVWYVTSFRDTPDGTVVEVVGDYDLPSRLLPEVQRFIIDRVIARDIRRAHRTLTDLVVTALGDRRRFAGSG
jgi:hypothetical protein